MTGAKLGLRVTQSQQLTLTPQLRQAIRLLQLSAIELELEVREALESNPTLELESEGFSDASAETETTETDRVDDWAMPDDRHAHSSETTTEHSTQTETDEHEDRLEFDFADELQWRDVQGGNSDEDFAGDQGEAEHLGLRDHLLWQLSLAPFSDHDRQIAIALIDAVEPDGYLREDALTTQTTLAPEVLAAVEEIEAVRHRLQHFEPLGVLSRTLQECLRVQLLALPRDTIGFDAAMGILAHCLDAIPKTDPTKMAQLIHHGVEDTRSGIDLIRHLDPRPGKAFDPDTTEYIAPDVVAFRESGQWRVKLAGHSMPNLRVSRHYSALARQVNGETAHYLRGQLQEARWLLKALKARGETLLRVSQTIVREQSAFLDHGAQGMRPLTLRAIAEQLDLHESTVSRATSRKYLYTPRGTFELKFFFSSGISTEEGGEASATAIRALIRNLIDQENPRKPMSDQSLAEALKTQGIPVARRTVAKYREAMNIPASSDRSRVA